MNRRYIYVMTVIITVLLMFISCMKYITIDVASLKQNLPVNTQEDSETTSETSALPSFLESSTGVETSQDIGLTGSADPTVPLSYTEELTNMSLENDIKIYGVELTKEEKEAILAQASGNSNLDSTISNNMTDNSHKATSTNIILTTSLADFCNY